MNIGIDVDGVLTDYEFYLDYFARKLDSKVNINKYEDDLKKRFAWSEEQVKRFYRKYFMWYVRNMPIREDAATVINTLKNEGHNIYIITARAYADRNTCFGFLMRMYLKRWLSRYAIKYNEIIYVDMNNSADEKVKWADSLKIDYFIEDTSDNIMKLMEKCKVICMRSYYNVNLSNVRYANDFFDVYQIINDKKSLEDIKDNKEFQKQYYLNLPYDSDVLMRYKRNSNIAVKIIGSIIKKVVRIEIKGTENIPDGNSNIFVCNHRRSFDIPLLYITLADRYVRFLIKKEYELLKLRYIQKPLGTIYVNRESKYSSKTAQTMMIETVLNNENILIFPEGTRNRTEKLLLPFRYGAVKIAQLTGAPIIPILIKKDGKRSYSIAIGDSFYVGDTDCLDNKNNELRNKMLDMMISNNF